MALFGSKEKKPSSSKSVRPTVVRTQNVAKEIQNIAKSYEVPAEKLDFNILEVQTYTRMNDENREAEWELVEESALYELDDQTALLNPFFQIKQTYEIEIFSLGVGMPQACPDLRLAIGANATKCKVYISVGAGSKIRYKVGIDDELTTLINKKKIRAGILIGIFDEMLKGVVSKISADVRVNEEVVYEKAQSLLVAESIEPTATTDDDLILHYENNKQVDESEKVDYASRGFIQSVVKDELLIEYIKPRLGTAGRNCRGEYMEPSEPKITHEVTFKVDSTIRVEEDEVSIKYFANENGYIAFEDNTYLIKNDLEIDEVSFKKTGSIRSGVNSDVILNVSEADAVKDAVGTGMHVEVTELEVEGNVGSHAKVIAQKATIGGQTHSTAFLKADDLDINVHKGKAVGKEVKITRLEHGKVKAERVRIAQALGGTIVAKEIEIEICASHVKATASQKIEIQKMQGSENTFTINPVLKEDVKEGLEENKESIEKLKKTVRELEQEIKKYEILIKEGTPAFLEIKKRLVHYKKSGVKLPASFVKKYKEFTHMQEHLKEIQKEYAVKNDQLNLQTTRTASFQESIFDARVINRDRWVGYNEIRFILVDPPMKLVYKPAENSKDMIFGLVELEDGEYAIKAVKE